MSNGLYTSASAMATQMARMDVLSNNLANVATTAFKPDSIYVRQRQPVRYEDALPFMPSSDLIERLGAGVMPTATSVGIAPAALEQTGAPLDLGIEGEGYLVVRAASGDDGLRLTRDGRLAISADGRLVTASGGQQLLGQNDRPLTVAPGIPIVIQSDGTVLQDGSTVGRLQFVTTPEPTRLIKTGANLLRARTGVPLQRTPASGLIRQGHLERSGVNAIKTLMGVEGAARAAQGHARIIGYYDELMGLAIERFGRVA